MVVVVAAVLAVAGAAVVVARVIGADERRAESARHTTTTDLLGPAPTAPARPAAFGNLISNWSFEQDLSGWAVIGPTTASREPQGRTSGSSASLRATRPEPNQVGLALVKAVPAARRGSRYVASVWVRATPGLKVTLRLVETEGGSSRVSETVKVVPPGDGWRKVTVAHTVTAAQAALDLQITAADVSPGQAFLVDEVELRMA